MKSLAEVDKILKDMKPEKYIVVSKDGKSAVVNSENNQTESIHNTITQAEIRAKGLNYPKF